MNNRIDAQNVGGMSDAQTINSSQGKDFPGDYQVLINPVVLLFGDFRTLRTAFTRGRARVFIIWAFAPDHMNEARLNQNPFLRALWATRDLPDDFDTVPTIHPVELARRYNYSLLDKRRLSSPYRSFTNKRKIDWPRLLVPENSYPLSKRKAPSGTLPVPAGGAYVEPIFSELAPQSQVHYSQVRDVLLRDGILPPIFTRQVPRPTHYEKTSPEAIYERVTGNRKDRFSRELKHHKDLKDGVFSIQFNDLPQVRRDAGFFTRTANRLMRKNEDIDEHHDLIKDLERSRHMDLRMVNTYHQMRAVDSVSRKAGIKKRITFANPLENIKQLNAASNVAGPVLWASLQEVFPSLQQVRPFDRQLRADCEAENESNRISIKSRAQLTAARDRAEPEWSELLAKVTTKSEYKAKGSENPNGKPHQTLVTMHDNIFFRFGWVARYITRVILDMAPPNMFIYLTRSPADLDAWCKKNWRDVPSQANDFTAYDQGQAGEVLHMEIQLMLALSIPYDIISQYVFLKTNMTSQYGSLAIMRFTGEVFTFIFNTLFNIAITNVRFELGRNVCCFAGDDSAVNKILLERPTWSLLQAYFTVDFKLEKPVLPEFVSWFLTSKGIFKNPDLLLNRFLAKRDMGMLGDILVSYLYEFAFGHRLGDDLQPYLTGTQSSAQGLLLRLFTRSRSPALALLYNDDHLPDIQHMRLYDLPLARLEALTQLFIDSPIEHTQKFLSAMSNPTNVHYRSFALSDIDGTFIQGDLDADDSPIY